MNSYVNEEVVVTSASATHLAPPPPQQEVIGIVSAENTQENIPGHYQHLPVLTTINKCVLAEITSAYGNNTSSAPTTHPILIPFSGSAFTSEDENPFLVIINRELYCELKVKNEELMKTVKKQMEEIIALQGRVAGEKQRRKQAERELKEMKKRWGLLGNGHQSGQVVIKQEPGDDTPTPVGPPAVQARKVNKGQSGPSGFTTRETRSMTGRNNEDTSGYHTSGGGARIKIRRSVTGGAQHGVDSLSDPNGLLCLCGGQFSTKYGMQRHLKLYTGEKVFKCGVDGCEMSFARHDYLKKHMKIKHQMEYPHGKWGCYGCGQTFSGRDQLNRHSCNK